MSDLYRTLGVSRNASANEIKSAYRRLARRYHPDLNSADSAAREFARITEAYQTLIDPQKRAYYDRTGTNLSSSSSRHAASAAARVRAARRAHDKARIDRIVNELLEREREATRSRGLVVFTVIPLFLSTLIAAWLKPKIFEDANLYWRLAMIAMFLVGVWHLGRNLKRLLDQYTYRPVLISLMRYNKPAEPHPRSFVCAVFGGVYLLALGLGMLIGSLTEDHSKSGLGSSGENLFFSVLFYPPIVVLIVDIVYLINQRFDEW
ncbi:MAG TPA: DnaJ domain-containing protein [Blastocatellia bacterium]|nr:DnaJ domain-containing protein [Blastocatellia bacterium]